MAIYTKKKENETTGSLLRRFTRRVQQSRVLIQARKNRFYLSQPTKRQKKLSALYRMKMTKERQRLEKLGLLEEEPKKTFGRR